MKQYEKQLSSELIFDGRVVRLFRDRVEIPDGRIAVREVVRHPGAVAVAPVTEDGKVIMVRQFRYPFSRVMLEVPAGKLDGDEDPLSAAKRELSEETGAEASTWRYLGEFDSTVAIMDERIHLYAAEGLTFHEQHPDEGEFLTVEAIPLEELYGMVMAGEIRDGKTQAILLKLWCLRQEKTSEKKDSGR